MGYRADLAANGLEVIDAVERQTYDVVLMDVQMPDMDGFEASREINHRWPADRRPRIVAMTANAMQGDRELCLAAGMDDYVGKPVRVEELVIALGRCRWRPEPESRRGRAASDAAMDGADVSPGAADGSGGTGDVPAGAADGSAAAANVPASDVVDRAVYGRLATTMGPDFVAELANTFIEDGRELIATLRLALAATDIDAFRRAAHSLKSNGETLGAGGLATLARELEAMARAGSVAGAEDRIAPLVREYEAAVRALGELRRGPGA
jgi:CheY-like chemotaxis protein